MEGLEGIKNDTSSFGKILDSPGVTTEQVLQVYEIWAETYDQDLLTKIPHRGAYYAATYVSKYLGDRQESPILDVAAGTGRVGLELSALGYYNVDALDASQAMLEKAKQKGCYKNIICEIFGKNRTIIDNDGCIQDTYDAVVTSASFAPGQLDDECFEEILRIVKPGGLFVLIMNQKHFETHLPFKERLEPRMQLLEKTGAWRRLLKEKVINYRKDKDGVAYVFQMQKEKERYLTSL